jgi:AraC-like DNA-binding protein
MIPQTFATQALPTFDQLDAWRDWYRSIFDVEVPRPERGGFAATNSNWNLDGLVVSRVSSPPNTVDRPKSLIRRNAVDHWAITLSHHSKSDVRTDEVSFEAPPGAPFILSLGEDMHISRMLSDNRMQLLLSRDRFIGIAPLFEAAKGKVLEEPRGKLLADYMLLLEQSIPKLTPEQSARLPNAVEAMLAACLAPSADRVASAERQINVTLMERVRRVVRENLRSQSLGPEKLCREAAMSRSQLYRVLESQGGVAQYIKRHRLFESFALLSDVSSSLAISKVAEILCFADASTFSRAFRREFGMSPSDVRDAALAGLRPSAPSKSSNRLAVNSFSDCLRDF